MKKNNFFASLKSLKKESDPELDPEVDPELDPEPDPLIRCTDPDPEQDPLVRGTDPGIRIRTKMSRIPNTARKAVTEIQLASH